MNSLLFYSKSSTSFVYHNFIAEPSHPHEFADNSYRTQNFYTLPLNEEFIQVTNSFNFTGNNFFRRSSLSLSEFKSTFYACGSSDGFERR